MPNLDLTCGDIGSIRTWNLDSNLNLNFGLWPNLRVYLPFAELCLSPQHSSAYVWAITAASLSQVCNVTCHVSRMGHMRLKLTIRNMSEAVGRTLDRRRLWTLTICFLSLIFSLGKSLAVGILVWCIFGTKTFYKNTLYTHKQALLKSSQKLLKSNVCKLS